MKAQNCLFLALVVLLTACEKDVDLASASISASSTAENLKQYVTASYDPVAADFDGVSSDYCIEVSASHSLVAFGEFEALRQQTTATSRIPTGLYSIEASGEGFSDELARSHTQLKMEFNSRTSRLTGTIITKFFNGEVLEQQVDGEALVLYDRHAMILKANVRKAVLNNGREILSSVRGELVLSLPLDPKGWFESNLYSIGMYCTEVVQ